MHIIRVTSAYFRPRLTVHRYVGNKTSRFYYSIGYAAFD
jgi:hypothetical protein